MGPRVRRLYAGMLQSAPDQSRKSSTSSQSQLTEPDGEGTHCEWPNAGGRDVNRRQGPRPRRRPRAVGPISRPFREWLSGPCSNRYRPSSARRLRRRVAEPGEQQQDRMVPPANGRLSIAALQNTFHRGSRQKPRKRGKRPVGDRGDATSQIGSVLSNK